MADIKREYTHAADTFSVKLRVTHIDPSRLSAAGFGGADDSSALHYRIGSPWCRTLRMKASVINGTPLEGVLCSIYA
eukprot:scaffold7398_cov111-Skeletonema_marinoi.AAC.3